MAADAAGDAVEHYKPFFGHSGPQTGRLPYYRHIDAEALGSQLRQQAAHAPFAPDFLLGRQGKEQIERELRCQRHQFQEHGGESHNRAAVVV